MRILLDTNALLWSLTNAPRIEPVRSLILSDDTEIFVSAVSWWEIAIKTRIGKIDANVGILRVVARESGFLDLPLTGEHAEALLTLQRHHNDPFDHMLVAQAISEPMQLITGDKILSLYTQNIITI